MSSYWEHAEKFKRRRRIWSAISAILTVAITAFYLSRRPFPEPRSMEKITEDRLRMFGQVDKTTQTTTETTASHLTDIDVTSVVPTQITSVSAIEEPTIKASDLETRLESDCTSDPVRSVPVPIATNEESNAVTAEAAVRAAEEAAKELQRLREAVDRARKAYQAEVARHEQKLLDEFGGPDWAAVRQQVELAEAAEQPQVAVERFNKAIALLKDAIPGILTRQTFASLDAKEFRTAFEQLRQLRRSFPDHAGLEEIRNRVANLPSAV